jgi:RimJ/RimL family protein N-acetyltransferase
MMAAAVTIRPLDPTEWEMFRDFRLAALQAAPGVFSASYDEALARTPGQWQATIGGTEHHQVFGLFDGPRLVGITAVFESDEHPARDTAIFAMSFILPPYRGRDLSRLLYEARLAWVRAQPRFRRVLVSVRASNLASQRANRRYGFTATRRAPRLWPDGTTEDEVFYRLDL